MLKPRQMRADNQPDFMSFISFVKTSRFWKHLALASVTVIAVLWASFMLLKSFTHHDEYCEVPDFVGVYGEDLDEFISGHPLRFEVVDSVHNMNLPKGTVTDQDPQPGSKVKEGRTVYLTMNAMTNPTIPMPNLVDLSLRQATSLLETYGLKVGKLRYVDGLPPVMDQLYKGRKIKPGEMIEKGSAIDLVLGKGNAHGTMEVPELFGLNLQEARMMLMEAGLIAGVINQDKGSDTLRGRVYKQMPAAGEQQLYPGASVDLWLTTSEELLSD